MPARTPVLGKGPQTFSLRNDSEFELIVRVERLTRRSDCLTAATISTMAIFKQLCPEQLISGNVLGRMAHGIVVAVRLVGKAGQKSRSPEPGGFEDLVRLHQFF